VSANLIFPIYRNNDIPHLEKIVCGQRVENFFCMPSSLLESVIVTEFQATDAYSSLDLTKAKYSIGRLSMVEKENVSLRINANNFFACEERKST
jgi:hypothetical protein